MRVEFKWVCLFLAFLAEGCNHHQPVDNMKIPESIKHLDNLTVYSSLNVTPDTVEVTKEVVFEAGDKVFMSGYISEFTVDNSGRVYIVSGVPGNLGVYVFNPDGSYLTTIGSYGQGPGEFEAIGSIDILENELILLDPRLQKFVIYSLDSFEKTREEVINLQAATRANQISSIARGTDLVLLENGEMVLEVGISSLNEEMDGRHIYYFLLERDGTVNPEKLLKVDRHVRYFLPEREGWAIPVTKPFNRSSLVSITRSGDFYTAWTEDFLIKKYDSNGLYTQAIYYPVEKSSFSIDQIQMADHEHRMIRGEEIPDTWPVLHTMELDDKGKLWVATITESETEFTWWVLNRNGELLARFMIPGNRSKRAVISEPLITVKNGYFYSHERILNEGIDRIVKHKIEIINR